jgi:hypothetical protein
MKISGLDDEKVIADVMKAQVRWTHVLQISWYVCVTAIICTVILRCT